MIGTIISGLFYFILLIITKTAVLWGPVLAMYAAFEMWHHFVTDRFILGMRWTLFEIEVPREVEKTPMAMELILSNAMYHASIKGLWEIWIQGAPHFWFSLEMAGIDGNVHFYIRTPTRLRDLVETQIYAQYPQAKVREVEDYALKVPFEAPNQDWYMWGCEFKFLEHDALPIRTYIEFGLDKPSDKEQQKIDPITPTIEFLGSLKRGQQVWVQHIIRPSKKVWHSHEKHKHVGWVQASYEEINVLMAPYTRYEAQRPDSTVLIQNIRLPKPIEDKVEKIRNKITKLGFDVGIRVVVVCEARFCSQAEFDGLRRSVRLIFRQYNAPDSNSLIRVNSTQFDSPFQDPSGLVLNRMKRRMISWYRLRIFFHPPFWYTIKVPKLLQIFWTTPNTPNINVLNVEEIATLFHFPGQVSQAPSFRRVESKVAKPPANLPI